MTRVLIIVLTCAAVGVFMTAWVVVQEHRLLAVGLQPASGELVAYEPARQVLIVRTRNGDRYFRLREDTPVHEGASVLTTGDLASASGCLAKVWYRDTSGTSIANDVRISCGRLVRHAARNSF